MSQEEFGIYVSVFCALLAVGVTLSGALLFLLGALLAAVVRRMKP